MSPPGSHRAMRYSGSPAPGGPQGTSRIDVPDLGRKERDTIHHVAAVGLLVEGAGLTCGVVLFILGAVGGQGQRVDPRHGQVVDANLFPVPVRRRPVDAAPVHHRAVPHPAEVPVDEPKGLDEAVLGIEDGHAPVARIRDPDSSVGAEHETVRIHELPGSLALAAMGREVSAIRPEDAQFLYFGIENGESSAVQHDETLQVPEPVRSVTIDRADAELLYQRPHGSYVRRRNVRDAHRPGRQRVPHRGPVAPRRSVSAASQGAPRHGDQGRSHSSANRPTPFHDGLPPARASHWSLPVDRESSLA